MLSSFLLLNKRGERKQFLFQKGLSWPFWSFVDCTSASYLKHCNPHFLIMYTFLKITCNLEKACAQTTCKEGSHQLTQYLIWIQGMILRARKETFKIRRQHWDRIAFLIIHRFLPLFSTWISSVFQGETYCGMTILRLTTRVKLNFV